MMALLLFCAPGYGYAVPLLLPCSGCSAGRSSMNKERLEALVVVGDGAGSQHSSPPLHSL